MKKKLLLFKYLLYFSTIISIISVSTILYLYHNLPDVSELKHRSPQPLIQLFDNQNHLFKTYGNYDSNYIIYNKLPKYLIDATIAIEDKRFLSHHGIDIFSIPRAFLTNLRSMRYVQGASTISQQLAKMLFLTPQKTLSRKFKEALLAIKIEKHFSKLEILEMYLNKAYFGSGNYGIVSAAKNYFDKDVPNLSLNESALLAGLLKAPSKYSPKINAELSKERTNIVLEQMYKNNFISEEQLIIASYQDNAWSNNYVNTDNYKYYTDWVMNEISEYTETFPFNLKLNTTFDSRINDIADRVIFDFYKKTPELKNTQISFVAMRHNGAVLSMMGGYNYKKSQFNRAVYGKRQPGSAFKLFVYLEALKHGYSNSDKVVDSPINISGWEPKNYDLKHRGEMTMRESFVRSINSVAAGLAHDVGIPNIINLAHNMGIKSEIPNLPSISLGTAETSLLELVTSYAVIANGGYQVTPYSINMITDDYDNVLFTKDKIADEQLLAPEIVEDMSNLLHGVVIWGTGKAANVKGLYIRGKTGTSQNYRDAWFIGFTKELIIGIWIGKENNKTEEHITGGQYPAQIFKEITKKIYFSD